MISKLQLIFIFILISAVLGQPATGPVVKITDGLGGLPAGTLSDSDIFGFSVASLGDLDGDGIFDIVVGAPGDSTGGMGKGAIYLLTLNLNYTVNGKIKIASGLGGFPNNTLSNNDQFGTSVTLIGDVDGDGIPDIAVGAPNNADAGFQIGSVYILLLSSSGNIKTMIQITDGMGGLPVSTLPMFSQFGLSLAGIGDLNQDGVPDLAVGTNTADNVGQVLILFLNSSGMVESHIIISNGTGGFPIGLIEANDRFGKSIAPIEDLDNDGVQELLVGASGDDTGGDQKGSAYLLYLQTNGVIKSYLKLADGLNGMVSGELDTSNNFGRAVSWLAGLESNGETYLALGANDNIGGVGGAIYLASLSSSGLITELTKIADGVGGLPAGTLIATDAYGSSIANLVPVVLSNITSPGQLGETVIVAGLPSDSSAGSLYGSILISRVAIASTDSDSSDGSNDKVPLIAGLSVTLPILLCCCPGFLVIAAAIILVVFLKRRSNGKNGRPKYDIGSEDESYKNDLEEGGTGDSTASSKLEWGDHNWNIDYQDLKLEQPPIASGAFGVVNKAKFRGTVIAVKTLIGNNQGINIEEFTHEVELLSRLHHPNIVLFMGATEKPRSIITEFVYRGSLYDVLCKSPDKFTPKVTKNIALGIARGMAYLHGHQPPVIHRDLKSQNILITKDYQAKIADFGISRTVTQDMTMTRRAGTTRWTAPEVLDGKKYTEKADVYSYSIVLWEMITKKGNMPFGDERWEAKVEAKVLAEERPKIPEVTKELQPIVNIMESCWEQSPDDRPTFSQIIDILKS